jgi:hypothetical protein
MTEDSTTVMPAKPTPFEHRMGHLAACVAGGRAIKIVAIGSSTTAGEGGIVPYPQRLEFALRAHYPGRHVNVLNRGVGGEEAPAEADRMQRDVIVENPCAVIWQVGTNAVWQKQDLPTVADAIRDGLTQLAKASLDIVLMDLQYTPAVLVKDKVSWAYDMERLINEAAVNASVPVNVFKRFDLMRRWHDCEKISFDRMVDPADPDRLHHSDWCASRMAGALADVMVAAAALAAPSPA